MEFSNSANLVRPSKRKCALNPATTRRLPRDKKKKRQRLKSDHTKAM